MSNLAPSVTDPTHPDWNHGRIASTASLERWAFLGFALVWNVFAQPMFWLVALERPDLEWPALLTAGLFPLAGFGLLYVGAVKWLQWRRFGTLTLEMDPFPGSLGGDIGGSVELPLPYRPGPVVTVGISCVHVRITRGKNGRRSERVLWRERGDVPIQPGTRGARVSFRFAVPSDQPATTEPSDDCIKWVVHLFRKLPGANLDQTFEVPVFDTGTPLHSRHAGEVPVAAVETGDVPPGVVQMRRTAQGQRFFYPVSRGRGTGFLTVIFGAVFGAVPVFIVTNFGEYAGSAFGMIFIAFGGFFVLVFGLIALFLLCFGVYTLFNSLDVTVSGQGVVSIRRFLGLTFTRRVRRDDIEQLRYRISTQQGDGARAKVKFVLEAVPATGKAVCLGDGIKGKPLAGRVMRELSDALGGAEWVEGGRRRSRQR
ncbi:MAG: hypothetical protein JSW10_05160 [Pseudomonadota bacterium]|nr:MAG: hypothetical protein JSW10_05160 [Pseudomonadota bacterium]